MAAAAIEAILSRLLPIIAIGGLLAIPGIIAQMNPQTATMMQMLSGVMMALMPLIVIKLMFDLINELTK